jgi:hypothetical protein
MFKLPATTDDCSVAPALPVFYFAHVSQSITSSVELPVCQELANKNFFLS